MHARTHAHHSLIIPKVSVVLCDQEESCTELGCDCAMLLGLGLTRKYLQPPSMDGVKFGQSICTACVGLWVHAQHHKNRQTLKI